MDDIDIIFQLVRKFDQLLPHKFPTGVLCDRELCNCPGFVVYDKENIVSLKENIKPPKNRK